MIHRVSSSGSTSGTCRARVHIFNQSISDEPIKSLVIKTEYTLRAVA
jgi:hypothetical protein